MHDDFMRLCVTAGYDYPRQSSGFLDNRQALIEKRYFESQHKNKELTTQLNAQKQNNKNLRSQFAEQRAMIESLRQEIQILSGRLEETDYVIKQKIQTSDDSYGKKEIRLDSIDQTASSNKDRIARIEQYLNFESTEPDLKAKRGAGIKTESRAEQKLSEDAIYPFRRCNLSIGKTSI